MCCTGTRVCEGLVTVEYVLFSLSVIEPCNVVAILSVGSIVGLNVLPLC